MQISVQLDNANRSYFPGQLFAGKVILNSPKEQLFEKVSISIYGKAEVDFRRSNDANLIRLARSDILHDHRDRYYAREVILTRTLTLAGNEGEAVIIPDGTTEFSFSTVLPENLLSNFQKPYGKLEYGCVAVIDRLNTGTSILSARQPFTIISVLDLNTLPTAKKAVSLKGTRKIEYIFRSNKLITYVIKLPRSGFVPGDNIPLSVDIDNQSLEKVYPSAVLYKKLSFRGDNKTGLVDHWQIKWDVMRIAKVIGEPIEPKQNKSWTVENLLVKAVPHSFSDKECKIISLQYELKVKIKGPQNFEVRIPIIIGTIPIKGVSSNTLGTGTFGNANFTLPSAPAFDDYTDAQPPSYYEASLIDR